MANARASNASRSRNIASPSHARSRAGSAARTAIVTMLKDDHKRVKKAFREFEKLDQKKDREKCLEIIRQVCGELTIHAEIEETYYYPAALECLVDEDLIAEAVVEHQSQKRLIADLLATSSVDETTSATFKVLREYVEHHVKEEEEDMFPKLAHADADWPS